MQTSSSLITDVAKKVQDCLRELGFEPESRASQHEALVHARKEIDGKCLRIVLHVSDRDAKSSATGGIGIEAVRARLARAAIRPTLVAQVAARVADDTSSAKGPCD
jgi:hypothetical protein